MYYPIVVAVLTLLNQGNLIHVTVLLGGETEVSIRLGLNERILLK
jgi:hypothetical protein